MKKPFFSIITCTYNSEKFLQDNIDSVKSQTFKDYEHIFIDGQSSDGTKEILRKYAKRHSKVKIFSYPPKGISNAFNKGIGHAKGNYLYFLNSDDCFYGDGVLSLVYGSIIRLPKIDWLFGKICEINHYNKPIGIFPTQKIFHTNNYKLLKLINFIPHQAVFIKKGVFEKFGKFDEKVKYLMDYEYWLRVGCKTNWKFIDVIVANYRYWNGGNSSSSKEYQKVKQQIYSFNSKYLNKIEQYIFSIVFESIHLYQGIKIWFKTTF